MPYFCLVSFPNAYAILLLHPYQRVNLSRALMLFPLMITFQVVVPGLLQELSIFELMNELMK